MKKVIFGLIAATSLVLYSCGSTKTESLTEEQIIEPAVTEEVQDTAQETSTEEEQTTKEAPAQNDNETLEITAESSEEVAAVTEEAADSAEENFDLLYPPLEEISEPQITDISIEEIIAEEEKRLQQENQDSVEKLEEPVPEEEILPPVQEENIDGETLRQAQGQQTGELESQTEGQGSQTEGLDENEAGGENTIEPIIEIQTEPEEETEPEEVIIPSRSVTLKKGETLIVTYPGNGWIYMGSNSEYNNLASRGRKLGSTDTKYTLLAKEAGTQIHHFYKTDNLTGEYIDDYLEVTVLDKKGKSSTTVTAPDYAQTVPKKPETPAKSTATKNKEKQETEKSQALETTAPEQNSDQQTASSGEKEPAKAQTTKTQTTNTSELNSKQNQQTQKTAAVTEDSDDDVIVIDDEETDTTREEIDFSAILEQAKKDTSDKKYSLAYDALIMYLEQSTDNRDEALYLLGQLLEADSPIKNIKEAINTYQTLCDNYPASSYWENANKRIIYLKRFYIDIH